MHTSELLLNKERAARNGSCCIRFISAYEELLMTGSFWMSGSPGLERITRPKCLAWPLGALSSGLDSEYRQRSVPPCNTVETAQFMNSADTTLTASHSSTFRDAFPERESRKTNSHSVQRHM